VRLVLAAAGLKAGQEDYWIRQIAESRCEYLSGHGETPSVVRRPGGQPGPGRVARDEQCHAMFAGKDPITGEQVAQPKWVADPRSKLPAGPLAERLRALADERSIGVEDLAGSQALAAEVRSVLARREVKAETVERVARHILTEPRATGDKRLCSRFLLLQGLRQQPRCHPVWRASVRPTRRTSMATPTQRQQSMQDAGWTTGTPALISASRT
jgi:hypothetical protein